MGSGDILNAIQQLTLEPWIHVSEFGPRPAHARGTLYCKRPVDDDYHGGFSG